MYIYTDDLCRIYSIRLFHQENSFNFLRIFIYHINDILDIKSKITNSYVTGNTGIYCYCY